MNTAARFDWQAGYPSRRSPLFARNVVSTSHPLAAHDIDGPDAQHLMIEAMKLAFADVYRHVAEPRAMSVSPAQLLDAGYLAERAKRIDPRRDRAAVGW